MVTGPMMEGAVMEGALSFAIRGAAALACALAAIAVLRAGRLAGASVGGGVRADRMAGAVALSVSALWCVGLAAFGPEHGFVHLVEVARNLAWLWMLYRLFANDGRDAGLAPVRPMAIALAFVEMLQVPLIVLQADAMAPPLVAETAASLRMLVAMGALVLLHNLVAGGAAGTRRLLGWSAGGLALLWGFELHYHTVAWLTGGAVSPLAATRSLAMLGTALAVAIGFTRMAPELRFRPSRTVTFQLLSLGMIGSYLFAMLFLSQRVAALSGDLARVTQVGFLLAAAALALLWLPSSRLRGWMRVVVLKHLFRHRYDYRGEWLRFTATLSDRGEGEWSQGERPLRERAIRALADIAESPGGLLLTPDEDGVLHPEAAWNWPLFDRPGLAAPCALAQCLAAAPLILDFDEVRRGVSHHGEAAHVPAWLVEDARVWAGVPLIHHRRLVGLAILARPEANRRLDWEDFDLFGIAGRQVASHLAEQAGQEALEEAARFDEFNRRIAFVMHDIKNLSSQMGLLVRNAERHIENADFRADMLVTLRHSTDKLDQLTARLGRYGAAPVAMRERVDLAALARAVAQRLRPLHDVHVADNGPCPVLADREALEQAVAHLVRNAVDASGAGTPVRIDAHNDGLRCTVAISDAGEGMSARFVRTKLFRPFVSTKPGGFGIGAHEARETVRAMGGRLEVESREGLGSRFVVDMPIAGLDTLLVRSSAFRDEAA